MTAVALAPCLTVCAGHMPRALLAALQLRTLEVLQVALAELLPPALTAAPLRTLADCCTSNMLARQLPAHWWTAQIEPNNAHHNNGSISGAQGQHNQSGDSLLASLKWGVARGRDAEHLLARRDADFADLVCDELKSMQCALIICQKGLLTERGCQIQCRACEY